MKEFMNLIYRREITQIYLLVYKKPEIRRKKYVSNFGKDGISF